MDIALERLLQQRSREALRSEQVKWRKSALAYFKLALKVLPFSIGLPLWIYNVTGPIPPILSLSETIAWASLLGLLDAVAYTLHNVGWLPSAKSLKAQQEFYGLYPSVARELLKGLDVESYHARFDLTARQKA